MDRVKYKMIDVTYKIEHLTIQGANEDAMRIFLSGYTSAS